MGYPQTSGLLTTAYQNGDGYNYVYFFDNFTPGKLRVIRDMPGMTEVDHSYTTMETYTENGEEHTIETAYVLFTPDGAQAEHAICSPVVDEEGNIYFKNDSAQLMRLSSRITELEVTQQPDRTTYSKDDTFDGTGLKVTAHYANGATKDVSDYLKYTTDPLTLDDTEITIGINLEQLVKDKLENLPENLKNQTAKWQQYQDKDGKAGVEWEIPTTTVTITVEEHHNYGGPTWTWNDDFTASAVFTCTDDDGHTQTVPAAVTDEVTTEPTCDKAGLRTYTAKVTFEGKDYTDTKTEPIPAKSHDTELVGAKDATCTEDGYTGNEVCKICQTVVKQGEVIPALGHDYKDGKCSRCGAEEPTTPVEPGKPGEPSQPTQPEKPNTPDTPATGDSSNMTALWVVLAVAGLGIIALVVLLVTKRKSKRTKSACSNEKRRSGSCRSAFFSELSAASFYGRGFSPPAGCAILNPLTCASRSRL